MREKGHAMLGKRARRMVATATAFTFFCQNFAWAVCADGTTFPPGGFVAGHPPVTIWSPGLTGDGSVFVPDNSVFEHNDPGQPVTGGGHNWVFDVNSFCKAIDIGPAGGTPTAWTVSFPPIDIPPPTVPSAPANASNCGVLWPLDPRRGGSRPQFRHHWSGRDHHADLRSNLAESGRRA